MSIQVQGSTATNLLKIDNNFNISVIDGIPSIPSDGGWYTVAGGTSGVTAATLAANTTLMSMRFSASSSRMAYVNKFRVVIVGSTVGTSALVAGTIGLQRFTTATPTGGAARVVNKQNSVFSNTDMTDVRDSNAALTVTSVVFGTVVSASIVPLFISQGQMSMEWITEPPFPIILAPGDGLALRTQVVMPGTQTWMYSYTVQWSEK